MLEIPAEMWAVILSNAGGLIALYVKMSERLTKLETEMYLVLKAHKLARRAEDGN